jgi:hypothetical protein
LLLILKRVFLVLGLLLLLCFDLELVESCSGEQEEKKIWAQEGISYDGLWQEAPLILGFVKSLLYYSSAVLKAKSRRKAQNIWKPLLLLLILLGVQKKLSTTKVDQSYAVVFALDLQQRKQREGRTEG